MKWVPLTDDTLSQLRQKGYTRLVVKSVTAKVQIETHKEFVTLEAIRENESAEEPSFDISSELTEAFIHSNAADYYVLYK